MNISVLGSGRWGTCIAWYLHKTGHNVTLWGHDGPHFRRLIAERRNDYMALPDDMILLPDLSASIERSDVIVISISAQSLRSFVQDIALLKPKGKTFLLCMKGIEKGSGCRLTEIVNEYLAPDNDSAVWVGPGHVQNFIDGIPSCMVIDSAKPELTRFLVDSLSSDLIRFYYGDDLIGTEIGAASKNVMGIAAGMLDGAGLTSLKGPLMSRGICEISRLVAAMGGKAMTPYGLCHLGDYEATLFSPFSHNRLFGELYIQGLPYGHLAEGVDTTYAVMTLAEKYDVDMPVCHMLRTILQANGTIDAKSVLNTLFSRQARTEF